MLHECASSPQAMACPTLLTAARAVQAERVAMLRRQITELEAKLAAKVCTAETCLSSLLVLSSCACRSRKSSWNALCVTSSVRRMRRQTTPMLQGMACHTTQPHRCAPQEQGPNCPLLCWGWLQGFPRVACQQLPRIAALRGQSPACRLV